MSMTNCVNCGAAKEVSDLQCPFCGTKYADLSTFDLFHDTELFLQFKSADGSVKAAKAYITNTELKLNPIFSGASRDITGRLHRAEPSMHVTGSIDFSLYESI